jgi:glutamate synthase (NADPH/NADH)
VVRPDEAASFARRGQRHRRQHAAVRRDRGLAVRPRRVGERFCVRNSGATAVVEGVGDHACEYMTGGRVAILGPTGRNVAAGHERGSGVPARPRRAGKVNREMVDLEPLDEGDTETLRQMLAEHADETASPVAAGLLADWPAATARFTKVMPRDYKRVLTAMDEARRAGTDVDEAVMASSRPHRATSASRARGTDMADQTGFLKHGRELPAAASRRRPHPRLEGGLRGLPAAHLHDQAARCMDCGIPFCHNGCPLGNLIPEWNDLVWRDDWTEASERLHATNNFPEFTGRLCPAPCEAACVLGINSDPVTIKQVEVEIAERAWSDGLVRPQPPEHRTGRSVAVVGSGTGRPGRRPAAHPRRSRRRRARAGDRIGGLLRYGIPSFKMEKSVLDRRLEQMRARARSSAPASNVGVGRHRRPAAGAVRRGPAGRRLDAGPDLPVEGASWRHPPGDGVPRPVQPRAGGDLQAPPSPRRTRTS